MKKNAKTKVDPAKKEGVAWKLRSPDEVLAQSSLEWATQDGKAPVEIRCKVPRCPSFTINPPFCSEHFNGILGQIRESVMTKNATEMRVNGNNNR